MGNLGLEIGATFIGFNQQIWMGVWDYGQKGGRRRLFLKQEPPFKKGGPSPLFLDTPFYSKGYQAIWAGRLYQFSFGDI